MCEVLLLLCDMCGKVWTEPVLPAVSGPCVLPCRTRPTLLVVAAVEAKVLLALVVPCGLLLLLPRMRLREPQVLPKVEGLECKYSCRSVGELAADKTAAGDAAAAGGLLPAAAAVGANAAAAAAADPELLRLGPAGGRCGAAAGGLWGLLPARIRGAGAVGCAVAADGGVMVRWSCWGLLVLLSSGVLWQQRPSTAQQRIEGHTDISDPGSCDAVVE